jgi:hypothetical protein
MPLKRAGELQGQRSAGMTGTPKSASSDAMFTSCRQSLNDEHAIDKGRGLAARPKAVLLNDVATFDVSVLEVECERCEIIIGYR